MVRVCDVVRMVETEYLWMCLATTAATFFGWKSE